MESLRLKDGHCLQAGKVSQVWSYPCKGVKDDLCLQPGKVALVLELLLQGGQR